MLGGRKLHPIPKEDMLMIATDRKRLKSFPVLKLFSRMLCLLALVAVAGWVNTTSKAGNDRFSCVMSDDGYQINILSCGSSAGNFIYPCYPDLSCEQGRYFGRTIC